MNREHRRHAPKTVAEAAVRAVGWRRAMRVVEWLTLWGVYREAVGEPATVDEVAEWWGLSRSQGYRDQAAYRDTFGAKSTPSECLDMPENVEVRENLRRFAAAIKRLEAAQRQDALDQGTVDDLAWATVLA